MQVKNAAGVRGILIWSNARSEYLFRVYKKKEGQKVPDFTDYTIAHSDLAVTIDADYEAAFYEYEDGTCRLDHAPATLGYYELQKEMEKENE